MLFLFLTLKLPIFEFSFCCLIICDRLNETLFFFLLNIWPTDLRDYFEVSKRFLHDILGLILRLEYLFGVFVEKDEQKQAVSLKDKRENFIQKNVFFHLL